MRNENINGLNIFKRTFLYTACADNNTVFLKYVIELIKSVIELRKFLDIFSTFSELKSNKSKCEVAGLGALKGVNLAFWGMEWIVLMFNAIKVLGVY